MVMAEMQNLMTLKVQKMVYPVPILQGLQILHQFLVGARRSIMETNC